MSQLAIAIPGDTKTYRFADATGLIVLVIDEDGVARRSVEASTLPPGTTIAAFIAPPASFDGVFAGMARESRIISRLAKTDPVAALLRKVKP